MSSWKRISLGEISESVDYGVTASAQHTPVGPKFLRITDIQDGAVDWDTVPWCDKSLASDASAQLRAGDIVFARTGATTGKSFLIRTCPDGAVFASYLIRLRLTPDVEPRYVSHFFQTRDYWAQIMKNAKGVAQPGVNASTLKTIRLPLPSLAEQCRVAEILDRADALRAKRRAAVTQLDALTQSIFLDMFGDPSTNPRRWISQPLHAIIRNGDTVCYGVVQPGSECKDGVPVIRVGDLGEGRVNLSALKRIDPSIEAAYKRSRLRGDEILVSCVGSVGLIALAEPSLRGFNIARAVARIPLAESVDRIFVAHYLSTEFVQRYFTSELRIVSQPTLNIKQLSETRIFLPPLNLQKEFACRVSEVELLRAVQKRFVLRLDDLLSSIQSFAFRTEL